MSETQGEMIRRLERERVAPPWRNPPPTNDGPTRTYMMAMRHQALVDMANESWQRQDRARAEIKAKRDEAR